MSNKWLKTALFTALMMTAFGLQGLCAAEVARAQFTTGVVDREPVDAITSVSADADTVYFYTELRDMQGSRVTHRWEHNGEPMAEVSFDVGGPRWRVWSSKQMEPELTGTWRAYVVTGDGSVLASEALGFGEDPADVTGPELVPETYFMRSDS